MKTVNDYKIYCTEEQTLKALELDAPIEVTKRLEPLVNRKYISDLETYTAIIIPTAEELIGWLEEQDDMEEITILRNRAFHSWAYLVTNKSGKLVSSNNIYQSRPKATLASIDAALNYLTNNKKK